MTESMRTDVFGDARLPGQLFDELKHLDAADVFPPPGQKNIVLEVGLDAPRGVAILKPIRQFLNSTGRNGHQALLVALARHSDKTFIQI